MAVAAESRYAHVAWELWGTYAFLAVSDARLVGAAERVARRVLADVERGCSRFRDDSSLSRVNRQPGRWVQVDPLLVAAVEVALAAAEATEGLVDPCLGRAMVSLGYDRDLAELVHTPVDLGAGFVAAQPPPPGAWREVRTAEDAVLIPEGVALDLGATAKAWAADLVAATVVEALGCATVVSLGGDLRVLGPDGSNPVAWPVLIGERPHEVADGVLVEVAGGLATSSTLVRRWSTAAGPQHHLLDPRTGLPVPGTIRSVTAAGRTCVAANAASTAALIRGTDARDWLRRHDITARLVAADGSVTTVGDWPATTQEAPCSTQ